jgi:hypothetical protein
MSTWRSRRSDCGGWIWWREDYPLGFAALRLAANNETRTAVLLSIYRDRLLALPQKVKSGEGVFEVLTWR